MKLKEVIETNAQRMPKKYCYYWFTRWISIYLSWMLQKAPITPNMISMFGHMLLIGAMITFIPGTFTMNLFAVLLMHFSIICDYLDGSFARITGKTSVFAANYLDRMLHELFPAFVFLGVGLGTGVHYGNGLYIVLGATACMGVLVSSYLFQLKNFIMMRYSDQQITEHNFDKTFVSSGLQKIALSLFVFPMKYIRLVTLIFVLFQRMDIYIILYGIFLPLRALIYDTFMYKNFTRLDKNGRRKEITPISR